MKTKRIIGVFLTLAMLMSCICPVFAATTTKKFGDTITITDKSVTEGERVAIKVQNNSTKEYVLIDSAVAGSNGISYSFSLPSKADDKGLWKSGATYNSIVGDKTTETWKIGSSSTTTTSGTSTSSRPSTGTNNTGTTSGGPGIIMPNLSSTGSIEVILNPNVYEKYGITSASTIVTGGTKPTANTFVASITIDGVPRTSFAGYYDPVLIKVPYSPSGATSTDNIVVYHSSGNVVPRTLYKDGYIYVNTTDISGTFTIAESTAAFNDISAASHSWAITSVGALAARGVINGVGGGNYDPDRSVTRAEFIKMVVSIFNMYDTTKAANFTDVAAGEWYNTYVGTAQSMGITNGYEDGSFRPNNTITREEMSTMLYRAAEVLSVKIEAANVENFADDWNIQDYAKVPVYKMRGAGILQGVGENNFDPKNNCTRAQAAVAIYNMFRVSMAR